MGGAMNVIETARLILRTWREQDAEALYQINQDPRVVEFLPGMMTMDEVHAFMEHCNRGFIEHRFCLFAVELKATHELIGYIGLNIPNWQAHFTPCVEIGWRLGSQYWGQGYATESARAVLHYGFHDIGLDEIVSFTVPANVRSIRVMEKIGMQRDLTGDFAHPKLAAGHPLSKHVLFRCQRINLQPID
jgi:RimJ/RimL family protein N-acetyltransferase